MHLKMMVLYQKFFVRYSLSVSYSTNGSDLDIAKAVSFPCFKCFELCTDKIFFFF